MYEWMTALISSASLNLLIMMMSFIAGSTNGRPRFWFGCTLPVRMRLYWSLWSVLPG